MRIHMHIPTHIDIDVHCDARFPTTAQIAGFLWFEYMEIIWFPGNLDIWLGYDLNMPLVEDLFDLVSCRLQTALGRFRQEPNMFLILFSYYFHNIFILFPYCFHIIYVHIASMFFLKK